MKSYDCPRCGHEFLNTITLANRTIAVEIISGSCAPAVYKSGIFGAVTRISTTLDGSLLYIEHDAICPARLTGLVFRLRTRLRRLFQAAPLDWSWLAWRLVGFYCYRCRGEHFNRAEAAACCGIEL